MPYDSSWVEPEIFLVHEGPKGPVTVYHVYNDGDVAQGRLKYWFTLNRLGDGDDEFDVRELDTAEDFDEGIRRGDSETIKRALIDLIEVGAISPREETSDGTQGI